MTTPDDAVVTALHRDGPISLPAGHPLAGLTNEIIVVRDWPRRTSLVIADQVNRAVPAALHRCGFSTAISSLDGGIDAARGLAPFTFLVITPDALASDDAAGAVRELHRYSPAARLVLALDGPPDDAAMLVRAVRAGVIDIVDASVPGAMDSAVADGLAAVGAHRERVLAIGAHPDDVEIGCAGTLLDHRLRGDRVSVLTLSRGAVGGAQQRRVDEAVCAAEAIGAQLLFGDLPDTEVQDSITTIRLIEAVVAATNPTVIYVHSQHDSHQDHRAVAIASASATRGVRRVFAFQSPSATNEFRPTQFVAIDAVLQRKVQVLRMFDSQNGRSYLEPELVVAGSRYWARHLGANARYAEPFEVIRSVGDLRQSASVSLGTVSARPSFEIPSYSSVSPIRPELAFGSELA